MSKDGKTILSCDIGQMCMTVMTKPQCIQYYEGYNADGEDKDEGSELKNCASWYDGCNTCMVRDGKIGGCTRMFCQKMNKPYCKKKVEDNSELKNCATWYDGCNTCMVKGGQIGGCTKMFCATKGKAYCKKKIEDTSKPNDTFLKDCTSWYDGCNTCFVKGGQIGGCTEMACVR